MTIEWKVFLDDDQMPHLIISDKGVDRAATLEESNRAATILNEEALQSTTVKLHCRTPGCTDNGGWIERTREDAKKTVYACDTCGKPMQR